MEKNKIDSKYEEIYKQGYISFPDSSINCNPYKTGTLEHNTWKQGYYDSMDNYYNSL